MSLKYTVITLAAMFALPLVLLNQSGEYNAATGWLILAVGLVSVIRVRRDWYLFTIYTCILYFNYSIIIFLYMNHNTGLFATYTGSLIAAQGINILCVFTLFMLAAAPDVGKRMRIRSIVVGNRCNHAIVWVITAVLLFVLVFGFGRPDVAGVRGTPTTFYEYSTVLMIIGFYFSGENKLLHGVLVLVSAMYALQNFIFGGRVTGLQLILIIVFSLYAEKLTFKRVFLPGIMLFLLMSVIGEQRANFNFSANALASVIKALAGKNPFALDTVFSAYHTGLTFLDTLNFTGWPERLDLFVRWVISIFIGNRLPNANLPTYTQQFFPHYGGGVLPLYGYFYLSWLGVALLAVWCAFIFRVIRDSSHSDNGLPRCIAEYATITVPRWYLYSPSQLIRGVMLMCIAYFVIDYVDRAMKAYYRFAYRASTL